MTIEHRVIEIEMTTDGRFVAPPRLTLGQRVLRIVLIAAGLAAMLAVASLLLGFALILIPAAAIAGVIAWAMLRFQLWRAGRSGGWPTHGGGPGGALRP